MISFHYVSMPRLYARFSPRGEPYSTWITITLVTADKDSLGVVEHVVPTLGGMSFISSLDYELLIYLLINWSWSSKRILCNFTLL